MTAVVGIPVPIGQDVNSGIDYTENPYSELYGVGEEKVLGIPAVPIQIFGHYWRKEVGSQEYASSLQYALENGYASEGQARLYLPSLLFMSPEGLRHSRSTRMKPVEQGFFSLTTERLENGSTLTRGLEKNGDDLESSTSWVTLDGEADQGSLQRWTYSGNRFVDLPLDVGEVLMHEHALASLLELSGPSGGIVQLSNEFREVISSSGRISSASSFARTARVTVSGPLAENLHITADWFDPNGKRLLAHEVFWAKGKLSRFPIQFEIKEFLLGGEELTARTTYRFADWNSDTNAPSGKPLNEEKPRIVIDKRFGETVRYRTDSEPFLNRQAALLLSDRESLLKAISEYHAIRVLDNGPIVVASGVEPVEHDWKEFILSEDEEPTAALTPSTCRSSAKAVGSKVPFSFELHNLSADPIQVVRIAPDCGCIDVSAIPGTIPAGAVYEVSGLQEIQSVGPVDKKIIISCRDADGRDFDVVPLIRVEGLSAVLSSHAVYELDSRGDGSFETKIVYAFFGCADDDQPPTVSIRSPDLVLDSVSWRYDELFAEGTISLHSTNGSAHLGGFIADINVSGPLCPGTGAGDAVVYGTNAPKSYDNWPSCWVVLTPGNPETVVAFPVKINSAHSAGAPATEGTHLETLDIRESVLVVKCANFSIAQGLHEYILDTELGPVRFFVAMASN